MSPGAASDLDTPMPVAFIRVLGSCGQFDFMFTLKIQKLQNLELEIANVRILNSKCTCTLPAGWSFCHAARMTSCMRDMQYYNWIITVFSS